MRTIIFADGSTVEIINAFMEKTSVNNDLREAIRAEVPLHEVVSLDNWNVFLNKTENTNSITITNDDVANNYTGFVVFQSLSVMPDKVSFVLAKQSEIESIAPQLAIATAGLSDKVAELCPDLFFEWSGNGVKYKKGDRVKEHHVLYKCLQDHTSQSDWCPCDSASLWVRLANPAEEYPLIDNPILSTNPWMKGQKGRTIDDIKYVSLIDNNVWQPKDYPAGWEEVK